MFKNFRKSKNKRDVEAEFYKDKGLIVSNKLTMTQIKDKELVKKIEETWFEDPFKNLASFRADCMLNGRCPTCTMMLPCNHFEDLDQIIERGWFKQVEWDRLSHDL